MSIDSRIEERVLRSAWEEVPLWDIPGEEQFFHADGTVTVEPAIPREDVAAVLAAALESGEVTLYDRDDPDKSDIAPEEALAILRDESYWEFESAPHAICLFLTDSGVARAESLSRGPGRS